MSAAIQIAVEDARKRTRERVSPQVILIRRALVAWPIVLGASFGLAWLFAGWAEPWPIVGGFVALVGMVFLVVGGFTLAVNVADVLVSNHEKDLEIARLDLELAEREQAERKEEVAVV